MALNPSGPISLAGTTPGQSVQLELGGSGTTQISMNDTSVRTLAGVSSGAISMNNFYGKSSRVALSYIISSNTQELTINPTSIPGYIAGISDITITVNPGIYVWSDSTSVPGLAIGSATSGDTITLVNNGYIIGRGADGTTIDPSGSPNFLAFPGENGGPALLLNFPVTINNTNSSAYIAGGGGSGAGFRRNDSAAAGGGGAGGGFGGTRSNATPSAGGSGGAIGQSGGDAVKTSPIRYTYGGGGGGRILPGVGGVVPVVTSTVNPEGGYGRGGGAGGTGSYGLANGYGTISGGGGGWGASGGASYWAVNWATAAYQPSFGGGGSANGNAVPPNLSRPNLNGPMASGGAGGKAVNLNGNSVTWVSGDTTRVYGAVS